MHACMRVFSLNPYGTSAADFAQLDGSLTAIVVNYAACCLVWILFSYRKSFKINIWNFFCLDDLSIDISDANVNQKHDAKLSQSTVLISEQGNNRPKDFICSYAQSQQEITVNLMFYPISISG